jgi:hypothetical protein
MPQVSRPSVADALRGVADDARTRAEFLVTSSPQVMRPDVRARHIGHIKFLASQLDQLAVVAERKPIRYEWFETILRGLHDAGFFPHDELVSEVAHAVQQQEATT